MKNILAALIVAIASIGASASAQDFQAPTAESHTGFRVGGLLGGGFYMNHGGGGGNQGFGLGVQGGYTFDFGLYVGADLRWFIGQSTGSGRATDLQFSLDAGYDILVGSALVLRPMLGLGVDRGKATYDDPFGGGGRVRSTDAGFMLVPGFEALYDITDMFYAGGQIRTPIAFHGQDATFVSMQLVATGGLRF